VAKGQSRQSQIVTAVFFDRYAAGKTFIEFSRQDLRDACVKHGIVPLANMGDGPLYSYRYRAKLPKEILDTQPTGKEWVILGRGISQYEFRLVSANNILPNTSLISTKIPESTPEIIKRYAFSDEQALLARIRYNRLVDTFFGITTYSLQSHLRTTVDSIGQIEIDEIYVGVDKYGRHFVIPVQAKVGNDKIGYAQLFQDLAYCKQKYPRLVCRALSAKFMARGVIALFDLTISGDAVKIVQEKHYSLVPEGTISDAELQDYNNRAQD
jgi:hypothetical protein